MNSAQYFSLRADKDKRIVYMRLTGEWSMEVLDVFDKERARFVASLGPSVNSYACIADCRNYSVMTAEVARRSEQDIQKMAFKPSKLAFLVTSAIMRLQAARISHQEKTAFFASEEEALAWIAES